MRALIQRVSKASVSVGSSVVGSIGPGLVVLLGIASKDGEKEAQYLVDKVVHLRIFGDSDGKFNHSAIDVCADLLIISQFTLYSDTRKGRRPSFTKAAPPTLARELFNHTLKLFRDTKLTIATGQFQEHMIVAIHNDGPVSIMLDSSR